MNELPGKPAAERPLATEIRDTPRRRRRWPWLVLLLAAGGAGYAWQQGLLPWPKAGQSTAGAPSPGPRGPGGFRGGGPTPVTAAAATVQDLPVFLDALGTVQAFNTISVVPQVVGRITEIAFTEGQEVKAGEVLVRIDPRTYQAALDQVVATKAQHEAQLANARLDLQRYTQLVRNNGASQQTLDTQRATVAQLEAQVQFDQASIENARTQLDYTVIRSPIDGRVGLRQVDIGNLVQSSGTGIVTITQIRPISVTFTLPQQTLPEITAAIAAGPVQVEARLPEPPMSLDQGAARPANPTGTLVTLDNQVDQATGTIKLKATFPNQDNRLWPGAFVNVRLQVALLKGVTTVPLVAVQRGPEGAYVFLVQEDNRVRQRPVTLGLVSGSTAVVQRGVRPGDAVVTSGALRLTDGAMVQVAEPVRPPSGPAPARRRPQGGPPGEGPPGGPRAGAGEAQPGGSRPEGVATGAARRAARGSASPDGAAPGAGEPGGGPGGGPRAPGP